MVRPHVPNPASRPELSPAFSIPWATRAAFYHLSEVVSENSSKPNQIYSLKGCQGITSQDPIYCLCFQPARRVSLLQALPG